MNGETMEIRGHRFITGCFTALNGVILFHKFELVFFFLNELCNIRLMW